MPRYSIDVRLKPKFKKNVKIATFLEKKTFRTRRKLTYSRHFYAT